MSFSAESGPEIWEADDLQTGTIKRSNSPMLHGRMIQRAFDNAVAEFMWNLPFKPLEISVSAYGKTYDKIVDVEEWVGPSGGSLVSARLSG